MYIALSILIVYLIVGCGFTYFVGYKMYQDNKRTVIVGPKFGSEEVCKCVGVVFVWLPLLVHELVALWWE